MNLLNYDDTHELLRYLPIVEKIRFMRVDKMFKSILVAHLKGQRCLGFEEGHLCRCNTRAHEMRAGDLLPAMYSNGNSDKWRLNGVVKSIVNYCPKLVVVHMVNDKKATMEEDHLWPPLESNYQLIIDNCPALECVDFHFRESFSMVSLEKMRYFNLMWIYLATKCTRIEHICVPFVLDTTLHTIIRSMTTKLGFLGLMSFQGNGRAFELLSDIRNIHIQTRKDILGGQEITELSRTRAAPALRELQLYGYKTGSSFLMSKFINLRILRLESDSKQGLETLITIQNLVHLEQLSVTVRKNNYDGCRVFYAVFMACLNLRQLDLNNVNLSDQCLTKLGPLVESLRLSNNTWPFLPKANIVSDAVLLSMAKHKRLVYFHNNYENSFTSNGLLRLLDACPRLTYCYISYCKNKLLTEYILVLAIKRAETGVFSITLSPTKKRMKKAVKLMTASISNLKISCG